MDTLHNNPPEKDDSSQLNRRKFLIAGAGVAAASLLPHVAAAAPVKARQNTSGDAGAQQSTNLGVRKLGALEVSSIGLGVQNMHRKFTTTVPYRPEMIGILREAYDSGVTFFDCAEAYGPFENERILGEAIEPFRDKVRITSKFGWNIDPDTGERGPGLNSRSRTYQACSGGVAQATADRPHRPPLSTPR